MHGSYVLYMVRSLSSEIPTADVGGNSTAMDFSHPPGSVMQNVWQIEIRRFQIWFKVYFHTHVLHVWYIYGHLEDFEGNMVETIPYMEHLGSDSFWIESSLKALLNQLSKL